MVGIRQHRIWLRKQNSALALWDVVLEYRSRQQQQRHFRQFCLINSAQKAQDEEQIQTLVEQIRILLKIRNAFSRELKRLTL